MNIKKSLSLILLLVLAFSIWGADLNDNATFVKRGAPDVYEVIKARAMSEWDTDASMVLYEVNRQADSFVAVSELMNLGILEMQKAVIDAMAEWTTGGMSAISDALESPDRFALFKLDTDWTMVEWETNLQLDALAALR